MRPRIRTVKIVASSNTKIIGTRKKLSEPIPLFRKVMQIERLRTNV